MNYLIAIGLYLAGSTIAAWAFCSAAKALRNDAYWDDRGELEMAEEET